MFIYIATNAANGKKYVGQTNSPVPARWKAHVKGARSAAPRSAISAAIRKYGAAAFALEIVALPTGSSQQQLDAAERDAISRTRAKISAAQKHRDFSYLNTPEAMAKRQASRQPCSAATRAKLRTGALACSPETRARMSEGAKNRHKRIEVA